MASQPSAASRQQAFEFLAEASPDQASSDLASSDQVSPDRQAVLRRLRSRVGCLSTARESSGQVKFSTGSAAVDRLLPGGGLRTDAITEWVSEGQGVGAATLALIAASQLLGNLQAGDNGRGAGAAQASKGPPSKGPPSKGPPSKGPLVVVGDRELSFYPPAAVALGIPAERMLWVRPNSPADLIWSIDQALRCEAVAGVFAFLPASLDDRDARRFQLAAEAGQTAGLFLRPAATRHRPSFAEIRFHVDNPRVGNPRVDNPNVRQRSPGSGRLLQVTLDRGRGGCVGQQVWLEIEARDETIALHLAAELANPKASSARTRRPQSKRA